MFLIKVLYFAVIVACAFAAANPDLPMSERKNLMNMMGIGGFVWRDYTGKIPEDAFQANDDSSKPIYIGRAFLFGRGTIPGQINPGEKKMIVGYNGPQVVTSQIKILCGPPENFKWIAASKQNFTKTAGKNAFVAGYDYDTNGKFGKIGIGRVSYKGEVRVGKINLWPEAGASTYQITQVVGGNVEGTKYFEEYEVLTYLKY